MEASTAPINAAARVLIEFLSVPTGRKYITCRTQSADEVYLRKDRKSTRLNSSHLVISYAVFCLKKKNKEDVDAFGLIKMDLPGQRILSVVANESELIEADNDEVPLLDRFDAKDPEIHDLITAH